MDKAVRIVPRGNNVQIKYPLMIYLLFPALVMGMTCLCDTAKKTSGQ